MMVYLRDTYVDPEICRDGETTRRPLLMMDGDRDASYAHTHMRNPARDGTLIGRPGYGVLDDEQIASRREARQEMIDRSTSAWDARKKRPPDPDEDDDDDDDANDARAGARGAYAGYVQRLRDAWRHPPARDFAQPDQGTRPEDLALVRGRPLPHDDPGAALRSHLSTGPGSDQPAEGAQARKDRAYSDYTRELSEAWKSPRHATQPAPAILGIGPAHKATDPDAATAIERERERTHGGR
jgi:hypothetical protein